MHFVVAFSAWPYLSRENRSVAQDACSRTFLVQQLQTMKRPTTKERQERPLKGRWKLPFEAPTSHSVRREYRKCGAATICKSCREGAGHGPYLYAVWREGKKVKRKYLGRG